MTLDETKLNELLGRFVTDFGGSYQALSAVLGDRLGLYRALQKTMPATPGEVAAEARVAERYVREWLAGQAAGGYVTYAPASGRYSLTEEQRSSSRTRPGCRRPPPSTSRSRWPRTSSGSPRRRGQTGASPGTCTTRASTRGRSGSSAPGTS